MEMVAMCIYIHVEIKQYHT